jgi:hypothetical protein
MNKEEGMRPPTEFSVLYIIERQLPVYWQKEFEAHLKMDKVKKNAKGEETKVSQISHELSGEMDHDHYVLHAYVLKKGKFWFVNRRFFVLSKIFIYNVEADFTSDDCSQIEFKSLKWRVPITAMNNLTVSYDPKKALYKLSCFFNLAELNLFMKTNYGATKEQKKEKRTLKFLDIASCRDFLYQLKRLFHLNCVSEARDKSMFPQPKPFLSVKEKV